MKAQKEKVMEKKMIKRMRVLMAALLFAAAIGTVRYTAIAADCEGGTVGLCASGSTINVTSAQIAQQGARKAIQEALTTAQQKATASSPYTVIVAPGSYNIDSVLYIGSNTKLVLDKVTLTKKTQNSCIIRVGVMDEYKNVTGYFYKNITLEGGTLDGANLKGTLLPVGHAANVVVNGVTFKNGSQSHLMEVGGVNGLTVQNCTFSNLKLDANSKELSYEGIQLDIPEAGHFTYRSEDLANKNIKINDCSFNNMPRGVGSHSGILNNPLDGIAITNCTFSNMSSAAIQGQNWINCKISGNAISGSPRGIAIFAMRNGGVGTFKPSTLQSQGDVKASHSSAYQTPLKNQGIAITNNRITLNNKKDPYSDEYFHDGILVSGANITTSSSYSDGSGNLPKGNYYASGATVKGNTISTTGHGIRIVDARSTSVSNNTITWQNASSANYYGVQVADASQSVTVTGNKVTGSKENGIYINRNSAAKEISGNTVSGAKKNAVFVNNSSIASLITENKISSPGKYGIDIQASKAGTISKNTISTSKQVGIYVYSKGKVTNIQNNTVKSSGSNGIGISAKSSVTGAISGNNISGAKGDGILVSASKVKQISKNTITKSKKNGIKASSKSTITTISENTIKTAGICGIWFSTESNGSKISSNSISGAKTEAIKVSSGCKVKTISTPKKVATTKFSSVKGVKGGIKLKWKKVKDVTGYQIKYARDSKFTKSAKTVKIKGWKKTSKSISKLKKGEKYYVRIRAYKTSGKKTIYSSWSKTTVTTVKK